MVLNMSLWKYKGYEIVKVYEDLGEEDDRLNYVYEIIKDGKRITEALTLSNAKEFIDSDEDWSVLS